MSNSFRLTRRTLLTGVLGGVATTTGCTSGVDRAAHTPPTPQTVSTLLASDPFYVAHRGGGRDWPEMTAYAYQQASAVPGLTALEISVCLSADGVLVCSHDPTTTRVTGVNYTIAEQTWATLSSLQVWAKETNDPSQPARPFTRFEAVVEAYADRFVLFVEPKVSPAGGPLLKRLGQLKQPERIVWKQPVNSRQFTVAKQLGFATWGYVLNEAAHLGPRLERFAAATDIDMLGAPLAETGGFIRTVVDSAQKNGKPAITWAVRDTKDRERARRLGCRGLMTSGVTEALGAR